ncbi:hypothetical protein DJ252_23730 [Salmonella enterica subsp. enterica serovar Uzaramo]|uniref:Uncharacterized protein n=1 Tax=Salmonella enterica TaxID=28901 RepID=A0A759WGE8_SALER|nr:hypothetical protein [Salmonella enterica subsp. enterica serovar Bredeney]EEE9947941.1 hypothetical protein [Salmonella enterica subsp. enterica serovar Uzaramo]EEM9512512.1 hypothetical protein [Salmonella enterica]EIM5530209.1 hypothetical protein [Salmonella enterica subsp. enterica]EGV7463590.1 hypothetical protein [Salmonella enterica]
MSAPSGAAPYIPAALPPGCTERRECLPARQGPRIRSRMLHGPGVKPSGRSESPKPRLRHNRDGAALVRRRRGFSAHGLAGDVDGGA